MKAIRPINRKSLLILGIFAFLAFGASADPHWGPGFGYHQKHHYVYYPKQNFYYDPYLGTYIVQEDEVWVRQAEPPVTFAKININILPHVDLFVSSYRPYVYNEEHMHTYRLVTYIAPTNDFYLEVHPFRYDFSITPYYYYHPAYHGPLLYAYYDPNYYYHPAPPHGHHGHAYGHNHIPPGQWKKGHDVYPGHPGYYAMSGNHHGNHHDFNNHGPAPFTHHNDQNKHGEKGFPGNMPGNHGKQQKQSKEFPMNSPSNNHHGKEQGKSSPMNAPGNNHHGKEQGKSSPMNASQKQVKPQEKPQMENNHHGSPKGKNNSQPSMVVRENNSPKSQGSNPNQQNGGGKPGEIRTTVVAGHKASMVNIKNSSPKSK